MPGECQHVPLCVRLSVELLAVREGDTDGECAALSWVWQAFTQSCSLPTSQSSGSQGHGNPAGRSGPDTPKILIPGYCNCKETLKGASMGPEVHSKIAACLILPQRQAVGDGGGLGSSKEGKSSGETAGQWGQRKNPRWGGPLTDCCVASSSSLPVSGPQPLAQFNKGG